MLAAGVFDFCDGFAARLLKAYSPMGAELDSLADMVSFGVLPSVMLHAQMRASGAALILSLIPLLLAVFSGIRLAKFNVDDRQHSSFLGLPTPSSAMICGSLAAYCFYRPGSALASLCALPWFLPLLTAVLCVLLVCEMPMFAFKATEGMDEPGRLALKMKQTTLFCISAIVVIMAFVLRWNWTAVPLGVFLTYVLENAILALFRI